MALGSNFSTCVKISIEALRRISRGETNSAKVILQFQDRSSCLPDVIWLQIFYLSIKFIFKTTLIHSHQNALPSFSKIWVQWSWLFGDIGIE